MARGLELEGKREHLNRTQGFAGFMRFLSDAYNHFDRPDEVIPTGHFEELFETLDIGDGEFNTEKYPPGSSGETALYKDLLTGSRLG